MDRGESRGVVAAPRRRERGPFGAGGRQTRAAIHAGRFLTHAVSVRPRGPESGPRSNFPPGDVTMTPTSCPPLGRLQELLAEAAPQAEYAELTAHVGECAACRR